MVIGESFSSGRTDWGVCGTFAVFAGFFLIATTERYTQSKNSAEKITIAPTLVVSATSPATNKPPNQPVAVVEGKFSPDLKHLVKYPSIFQG